MKFERSISDKEAKKWIEELNKGNLAIGEKIINRSIRLIDDVIQTNYNSTNYDYALLFKIGYAGLIAAIKSYTDNCGSFKAHAIVFINQKIKHHIEKNPYPAIDLQAKNFFDNITHELNLTIPDYKYNTFKTSIRYIVELLLKTAREIIKLRYGFTDNVCHSNEEISKKLNINLEVVSMVVSKFNDEVNKKYHSISTSKKVPDVSRVKKKKSNSKTKIKESIFDYFPGYSYEEILEAVNKLNNDYQTIIFKRFGYNLDELNPLNQNDRAKFHRAIIPKLKDILNGKIIKDTKGKTISDYFPDYNFEELKKAIDRLSNDYQNLVYKRWGEDLNELNKLSNSELSTLRRTVVLKIRRILNNEMTRKQGRPSKNLFDFFPQETEDSIRLAINKLNATEQTIIYERYGESLKEANMLKKEDYYVLYNRIFPKLSIILKRNKQYLRPNTSQRLFRTKSIYSLINLDKDEINAIIMKLSDEEKELLYKFHGYNLENPCEVPLDNNDIEYVENFIIPKIRFLSQANFGEEKESTNYVLNFIKKQ